MSVIIAKFGYIILHVLQLTVDQVQSVTLVELVEHVGMKTECLSQRCQERHLKEIATMLVQSGDLDIPLLQLSNSDFNSESSTNSDTEKIVLYSLQSRKRKYGFKATYKCLVEGFLSMWQC